MIVNAYAVLDGFLSVLRLAFGLLAFYLVFATWRGSRHVDETRMRTREERGTLQFLTACLLVGLSIISWPVFYLLLQSYVPAWDGVMCIYGVTQIGTDSVGPARFLPELLRVMQLLKPALVFAGGAWLVMHLLNTGTASGPLAGRVRFMLLLLSALATADAITEISYLVIPKKEEFVASGCCTQAFDGSARLSRFLPREWVDDAHRPALYVLYFIMNSSWSRRQRRCCSSCHITTAHTISCRACPRA
jgi:hypothetical protein